MRQYVRGVLKDIPDVQLVEVASGFEAFRVLAREAFDLVITDINMPDINGLDLVRFIRKTDRLAQTKIVVITTQATPKTREKLQDLGVEGFVPKPFEPKVMTALVRGLTARDSTDNPNNLND
jgi:two-component system chemotaxis response regulator CheY